jgi:hypothetical protein
MKPQLPMMSILALGSPFEVSGRQDLNLRPPGPQPERYRPAQLQARGIIDARMSADGLTRAQLVPQIVPRAPVRPESRLPYGPPASGCAPDGERPPAASLRPRRARAKALLTMVVSTATAGAVEVKAVPHSRGVAGGESAPFDVVAQHLRVRPCLVAACVADPGKLWIVTRLSRDIDGRNHPLAVGTRHADTIPSSELHVAPPQLARPLSPASDEM